MKKRRFFLFIGISLLAFFSFANLTSCTKTNTNTIHDTSVVQAPPSTLSLLCGKQWQFDSVYLNYTGPGTGTVVYARGATGNQQNLDNFFASYTDQGQEWGLENNIYSLQTYIFWNHDSVNIKVSPTNNGTDYERIIKLTATSYVLYDSTAQSLDVLMLAP